MKCKIFTLAAVLLSGIATAQNVGIGTTEPLNKLQVQGNMLVNTPTKSTNTQPTAGQERTMINNSTIYIASPDSTGRIFDPGGPAGNYIPNLNATATINGNASVSGIELIAEDMQIGNGDSLIIRESSTSSYNLLAFGNGFSSTGKWIFNSATLYIIFKSNGDANVGSGFSLLFKRLYPDNSLAFPISGVAGNALFFDTKNGSFSSGKNKTSERGTYSASIGYFNDAIGNYSTAIGAQNSASGNNSIAIGFANSAKEFVTIAIGASTNANAQYSIAIGNGADANGGSSLVTGYHTTANGFGSTVMGLYNNPIIAPQQSFFDISSVTPIFIIGNGDNSSTLSNAMVVLKNGNIGIGQDAPQSDLHIKQSSGGGLMLENPNDGNKWRIYSASGDNNLTFYNNAGNEVADIDDVTGTYNAISDGRLKKNLNQLPSILPLVMKLKPTYYQFNWQLPGDGEKQLGLIAQDAYQLFPELVNYDKEKDLYKINYAGFSTVAIKAIQELQMEMETLKKEIIALKERLRK